MDSLDAAAMRRFDARVRLGYLGAEQAWDMFIWLMHVLKLINTGDARKDLDRMVNLTPGDFASVGRHCRLDPVRNATELTERLRQVSESKREVVRSRPIGFVA